MRDMLNGLLVVLIFCCILGGCAKNEVVKTEEPIIPPVVAVPELPPTEPEPPPQPPPQVPTPPPPPQPVKVEVVQELVKKPELQQQTAVVEASRIAALETIHFDFDKFDLREPDREILSRNGDILLKNNTLNIRIEGHCDERGSAEYNMALGEKRARSALNYLVTLGVEPQRVSIISFGEEVPLDPGHTEDAWAKNRRAQFVRITE